MGTEGPAAGAAGDPGAAPSRVLVVDDDPGMRGMMLIYLKRMGYTADTVSNGREAVDAVATGLYGILLLDCVMPELEGTEAARAIRAREVPGGQPWIVAFTAQSSEAAQARCRDAGMDAFLGKPFTEEEIRRVLAPAARARPRGVRAPSKVRPAPAARGPGGETRRVILVDDEAAVRHFVWDVLTTAGYEVTQVASGEDARWLLEGEKRPYDLLVVDVVMPGMGGPAFARWLKGEHPSTRVLFITGADEDVARMFGLPLGKAEVLRKPFSPDALLERVAVLLG
jgi:DNA-binding response OmpR family regulator